MEFVIIGKTKRSKDDLKRDIQKMGGKLGAKIHDKLAAVISTEEEVERMGRRMTDVKDLGIQVVPEDFIEDAKDGGAIPLIVSKSLCDWGTDVSSLLDIFEKFGNIFFFFLTLSHIHAFQKTRRNLNLAVFTLNQCQSHRS